MANYRDQVRTAIAEQSTFAKTLGLNVNDIRKESRGTQAMGAMIARFANDTIPTETHERIYADDFAGQVFNGTNNEFTLTLKVLGQNIRVWRVEQSTGTLIPLAKTTNPAPGGEEFWFNDVFTIRVGTAPQSLDGLLAVYVTSL